ncbi:MAG: PaaI family thioesterase [Pseudomonadota bacterium]
MTDSINMDAAMATEIGKGKFPGLIGVEILDFGDAWISGRLDVREAVMAPNGFLHAGAVIGLADTLCGYASVRALPKGASGFTTIETKSNHLGTARDGYVVGRAEALHLGKTTQVWDATVKRADDDKTIAVFRCTQMVLWPKS